MRSPLFANVRQTLIKHGVDVAVGKRVDDVFAVALELDKARLLQDAQLVRDGALGSAHCFGDVCNAKLTVH